MARGTLYHISVNPADRNAISQEDLFGHEDEVRIEYFADRNEDESRLDLEIMFEKLRKAGFDVLDEPGECRLVTKNWTNLKDCQMAFFKPRLEQLKNTVSKLDLRTFATNRQAALSISDLVDDGSGDAIYLDLGCGPALYTLHDFIRQLEPNKTYHISDNTILMH